MHMQKFARFYGKRLHCLLCLCPLKFLFEILNPKGDSLRRWGIWEVVRS